MSDHMQQGIFWLKQKLQNKRWCAYSDRWMVNIFLDTVSVWVKIQKLDEKLNKLIQGVFENEEASRRG